MCLQQSSEKGDMQKGRQYSHHQDINIIINTFSREVLVLDILKGLVNLHVLGKGQCLNWVEWKIS